MFAAATLTPKHKIFIVHVAFPSFVVSFSSTLLNTNIYPFRKSQIVDLIAKKAFTKILTKYTDFANVFSPDLAFKLFKHTRINNHVIKLVNNQQPLYGPIYSLKLVELETLKAYIETNLANGFIRPFKSPVGAPIFFD